MKIAFFDRPLRDLVGLLLLTFVGVVCFEIYSCIAPFHTSERIVQMSNGSEVLVAPEIKEEPVKAVAVKKPVEKKQVAKTTKFKTINGFICTKSVKSLRAANYGTSDSKHIRIWSHEGNKQLSYSRMKDTVEAVLQRMPNVKSHDGFTALIMETFMVETDLGLADYQKAAKSLANYGLGQFRLDTAKDTLKYLKAVRKDVYTAVMSMYDRKLSLKDNLLSNVPLTIALCAQVYLRNIPDIHPNVLTLEQRAKAWKVCYNSVYGAGSVKGYISKVESYYDKYEDLGLDIARVYAYN